MRKTKYKNRNLKTIEEVLRAIINPKDVTYCSFRSWMHNPRLIDDAIAEFAKYMFIKYQDKPQDLIKLYNSESQWIAWCSTYSFRQLQNKKSQFNITYNMNYRCDDMGGPGEHEQNLLKYIDDTHQDEQPTEISRLHHLGGNQITETITRILSNTRAIETFDSSHRELYIYLYLDNATKKIKTYKEMAEEIGISRLELMRVIKPIREFIKIELKWIEENNEWNKYILLK